MSSQEDGAVPLVTIEVHVGDRVLHVDPVDIMDLIPFGDVDYVRVLITSGQLGPMYIITGEEE